MRSEFIMPDIKMPDINNAIIAGSLTNDPVLRKTIDQLPVGDWLSGGD